MGGFEVEEMSGKVVAIAGGFDPWHSGHLDHIRKAAKLGDILVAITHPDETLVLKKGYCWQPLNERVRRLYEQPEVDLVVVARDRDGSVCQTLKALRPSIYAKGGDRTPENMRREEVDVCGEIGCEIAYGVGDLLDSSRRIAEQEGLGRAHIPPK